MINAGSHGGAWNRKASKIISRPDQFKVHETFESPPIRKWRTIT
jgi:hypothetical protein